MEYVPKYSVRSKVEHNGEKVITPFIIMPDGSEWNVWNIPEKVYTSEVEDAIKHAFELGSRAMAMQQKEIPTSKFGRE